tara:strand:- start:9925 stop:10203 length:279 start_codon:yes stop_codon:yes gene_type:complete
MNTMEKKVKIQNLKCKGCENTVISNLLSINGVENLALNVVESTLTIEYNDEEVFEIVRNRLSKIGYPIAGDENTILKKATSYVSCAVGRLKE